MASFEKRSGETLIAAAEVSSPSSRLSRRAILSIGASGLAMLTGGCGSSLSGNFGSFLASTTGSDSTTTASIVAAPLRVALLLPLSRDPQTAAVATDLKQAAEMAVIEQQRPGLTIIPKDTFGTPEGAGAAAREAIAEGVELIIGPLFASEVTVVRAIARPAGVPVIAFSTDKSAAGDGAWLLSFLAGADVDRVVGYAVTNEIRRFAALVPATPYGDAIASAFQASVASRGASLAALERFPPDAGGMVGPVLKLKAHLKKAEAAQKPIQGLLIAGGQETLPTLAPMLSSHGLNLKGVRLIGTGTWNVASISQLPALAGGWFAAPDPTGWQSFAIRYQKAYGRAPVRIAGLAHDAVGLVAALSSGPVGQRFSVEALTRPSGFAGIDGLFRLQPDGTSERGLAVLEVHPLGPRVIEAAPAAFGAVGF